MNSDGFEIEKKFLIRCPDMNFLKSLDCCHISEIEQIYLENPDGFSERIRKRGKDGHYDYFHTLKRRITAMRRTEEERQISAEEYLDLKKRADKELSIIYKTRCCIPYEGHVLEIDIFPFWKKQAFLEIELRSEGEEYSIPDFLEVIRDVTEERGYTNRALAFKIPDED